MRKRLTIAVAPVVVVVVVAVVAVVAVGMVVGIGWWRNAHRTDLEQAASYAPGDAQRLSWTDWAAVRDRVGADLDASSSGSALREFLDQGFDDDLTSTSALVQSAPVLQARFGFSPATADWELFSQSSQGAAVIVKIPDGTDFDELGTNLEEVGFDRPRSEDGVWHGGQALLPKVGPSLTPELQYVALDAADRLVLTSDTAAYLQQVVDGLGGDDLPESMTQVASASGNAVSAAIYSGPLACSELAMSQADASEQREADQLVREAGKVNPVTGLALSAQPDGGVRVVLSFEDDDQARTNAETRARLAVGPAPGQGGDFSDRFSVDEVSAQDSLVTMDLDPDPGVYVLSDLSSGPVLFATC